MCRQSLQTSNRNKTIPSNKFRPSRNSFHERKMVRSKTNSSQKHEFCHAFRGQLNKKKGQFKIGNQYFEQVCKKNSWVLDEMQANDFRKRTPRCFSLRARVPRPTKPIKLSKLSEDVNVCGNHLWMLAKGISASCL